MPAAKKKRTVRETAQLLLARHIGNDWDLSLVTRRPFLALDYVVRGRTDWYEGYVLRQAVEKPSDLTKRLERDTRRLRVFKPADGAWFNYRTHNADVLAAAKVALGGAWERSPFDKNCWHPAGTIALALGETSSSGTTTEES